MCRGLNHHDQRSAVHLYSVVDQRPHGTNPEPSSQPLTQGQRQEIMPKEVPATLKQFWFRQDTPGVIFLMDAESVDLTKTTVDSLPLAAGGFLKFEFVPVGPLAPLGLLLKDK